MNDTCNRRGSDCGKHGGQEALSNERTLWIFMGLFVIQSGGVRDVSFVSYSPLVHYGRGVGIPPLAVRRRTPFAAISSSSGIEGPSSGM